MLLAGMPAERDAAGPAASASSPSAAATACSPPTRPRSTALTTPPLAADCVERLRPLLVSVATRRQPARPDADHGLPRRRRWRSFPAALDVIAAEPADRFDDVHRRLARLEGAARSATSSSTCIARSQKPVCVCWPSPPTGAVERLAAARHRHLRRAGARHARARPARERHAALVAPAAAGGRRPSRSTGRASCPRRDRRRHGGSLPRAPARSRPAGRAGRASRRARTRPCASRETIGLPVGAQGHQPGGDASRRGRTARGRPAPQDEVARRLSPARRARRARSASRSTAFYVQTMAKGGAELLVAGLPRSAVRADDLGRRRRRPDRADRRRRDAARAGRRGRRGRHDRAPAHGTRACVRRAATPEESRRRVRRAASRSLPPARRGGASPSRSIRSSGRDERAVAVDGLLIIEAD